MCRWITVLSSNDMSLSDVVLAPQNSLLQLARDAAFHPGFGDENNHVTNGDGFGVGWYHNNVVVVPRYPALNRKDIEGFENMYAATFRDTAPAWNNQNLREICVATRSHCILAHVRAASRFAAVTQENCHPFKSGRLLFCHNGRIGNFPKIRRALLARMTDQAFALIRGTTDSESIFGLILTFLQEDGKHDKDESPMVQKTPFGHWRLVHAIKKTKKYIRKLLEEADALDNYSTLNFALTDGESMVVTRFCDESPKVLPPSLYFAYGDVDDLVGEITSKDPEKFVNDLKNQKEEESGSEDEHHNSGNPDVEAETDEEQTWDERPISLLLKESLPGRIYQDIDHSKAALVVASNPLTKTHTWNPLPRNSIMWFTRGKMPELRLLRDKKPKSKMLSDHTFVMDKVDVGPVVPPVVVAPDVLVKLFEERIEPLKADEETANKNDVEISLKSNVDELPMEAIVEGEEKSEKDDVGLSHRAAVDEPAKVAAS